MSVTINDIAKLSNVSKATVSSVLNNRPGISDKTREKILNLIKKLNYRPNQLARSLSIKKTESIGLVIKEIDNPYFAKVMKGIYDACGRVEYTVLLGSSELSPEKEIRSIQMLINQQVEGLIISPLQSADVDFSYISDLIREGRPLVMLNTVKNFITNVVDVDNVDAARTAALYLIGMGHKHIAYFSGPNHSIHSEERMDGMRQALVDHGLLLRPEDILDAGSSIETGFQAGLKKFSEGSDQPTAVLCYNDLVAVGLVNALADLGRKMPEDVSVVGFDDIEFCEHMKVPLSSVHIPAYEIGRAAGELLIRQIRSPGMFRLEKITIETRLVQRASVARKT
jgi:LacI family transcriptional regulator